MSECFYCEDGEKRKSLMIEICKLNYGYFEELAATAKAIFELYHPDKINYATFGDLVPHVHVHVVPKYKDGPDWGNPFDDTQGKKELTDAEYQKMVDELKETILKELNK